MSRAVTEADFRKPEFRDAKPEDYEFRPDGELARKDRWEMAVRKIVGILGMSNSEFEIRDVLDGVENVVARFPDEHLKTARTVYEGSSNALHAIGYIEALLDQAQQDA